MRMRVERFQTAPLSNSSASPVGWDAMQYEEG